MKVGRWTARLRQIADSGKEARGTTDKADKSPSVGSVGASPYLISENDPPLDPLIAAAMAKLVIDQALRRAAVGEPFADGYRVGVAVRMPSGAYATAVLSVPTLDGFAIIDAMKRSGGA